MMMSFLYQLLPETWKPWLWRYRLRMTVLSLLVLLYSGVRVLDWAMDSFLLDLPFFQSGPLKMTRRHFQAPSETVFTWTNMNRFLDEVTRNKPGILGQKWPYVTLTALYILLSVMVFLKLTEPDTPAVEGKAGDENCNGSEGKSE
jgi:hypothetical protein